MASRAYINLRDPADVPLLAAALDGRVFVTERGAQHRCSVEYAPCQRVPPLRVKRDPREGTIEAGASLCRWFSTWESFGSFFAAPVD